MSEVCYNAVGRRKKAIARVRLIPGEGNITINKDLAAYTVYREVRNANGALTAIKGVTTENKMGKADGRVYDLTGRQVTRPTRGVYVMNGRKVVL